MSGFWCLVFFGRWSMVLGWIDFIKRKTRRKNEFVSADARSHSTDPRTYEMLSGTPHPLNISSPDRTYSQKERPFKSPLERNSVSFATDQDMKQSPTDTCTKSRAYVSPVSSYSTPRPPSSGMGREWDPAKTHASSTETPLPTYSKRKDWGD
jgi:hypothetical protein